MILIAFLALLTLSNTQQDSPDDMDDYMWYYEATAYFWQYAMGEVMIINGNIMIDLDVSKVKELEGNVSMGIPENCFDDGVYFHIHDNWQQEEGMDYVGRQECDSDDQVGDHVDPWFACSRDSTENDCNYNGGCIRPSSFLSDEAGASYRCNSSIFSEYPYACEMSDYSKYKKLIKISGNKIEEEWSSLWEFNAMDIEDQTYGVVFHCGNDEQTPAFCAAFNVTNRSKSNNDDIPTHETNDDYVEMNFGNLEVMDRSFKDISIIQGEGWIRYKIPSEVADECNYWSAYIMNIWNGSTMDPMYNENCTASLGGVYDPTYSCITDPFMESGNEQCEDGTRCPDETATAVDYECDNWDNALTCAIGHLTGRTGVINMTYNKVHNKDYDVTFPDRVSPPLKSLIGKAILLHCEDNEDDEVTVHTICAAIDSSAFNSMSTEETSTVTAGGVMAIILLILMAIGISSAWLYSKNKKNSVVSNNINNANEKFAVIHDPQPLATNISINNDNDIKPIPLATDDAEPDDEYKPPNAPLITDKEQQQIVNNNTYALPATTSGDNDYNTVQQDDNADDHNYVLPATQTNDDGYDDYVDVDVEHDDTPPAQPTQPAVPDQDDNDDDYEYYEEEYVDDNRVSNNGPDADT